MYVYTVNKTYLAVGWILNDGENFPEVVEVPVVGRQVVHVEALGVQRRVAQVARTQPINLHNTVKPLARFLGPRATKSGKTVQRISIFLILKKK